MGINKIKSESIKNRLVRNFILIIFISISILEMILIGFVKEYYYNNTEEMLTNQIKISSDFYSRYFSNSSLEENILDNVDVFWKQTNAQVQILDTSGRILMDSQAVDIKESLDTADVKKAIKGQKGKWVGKVSYDQDPVMAVSYPLKSDDKIVGVLRFITSLKEVNRSIYGIALIFIGIGMIVIFISTIVSLFLADSIINPVKDLTAVAEKMAQGNLELRSNKRFNDEIGKLSDTLNYMAEEIIKKDQLKNDFISAVSHELRTPLTSIKGWAITLNSEDTDKEILKDGLNIIEKESDRLTGMVEELLDFSKFVSGKVKLEKRNINIKEMVEYIDMYMRPRAEREDIIFNINYEENIPNINVDINRMKQVLINVLDNSFKFTNPGGKVELNIFQETDYVVMLVRDNGCGISEEDLPKVKEKFYKGKSSKSQNGIGLSICDEIVKLHNGIFDIKSEVNKGTDVYIKIPFEG